MSTEGKYFCTTDLELAKEIYGTLDRLLSGIGLLPLGQVTSRPVLHKAVDRGMEVLDRAVREGRYVPQD